MATTIKSTQLDFDTIKSSLKDYLKSKTEFNDYDFEGSALSNILDVLAYNTHLNGLTANFALNESFLNTSQLRSSVVSHAETLGYVPRSYTGSMASLNLKVEINSLTRPSSVELPKGTLFTTSIDNVSYTFRTLESYIGQDSTPSQSIGTYNFQTSEGNYNITVKEGTEKSKTFYVGEVEDTQIYVIPDMTMDKSTLEVIVYDTADAEDGTTYTDLSKAVRITADSAHFQVKEVPNGYYEVLFGDGLSTGKTPIAGNKIVMTYLSVKGTPANGGSIFQTDATINWDGNPNEIQVTTFAESAGGTFKEDIESIRQNAPILFASQQRLVTAEDYIGQIQNKYGSYFDDIIAWGGADNEPPQFGKVYVGLKYKDGTTDDTKNTVQGNITSVLSDNLAVMSIDPVFVEPIETYLELGVYFNFDPDLTGTTITTMENTVNTAVKNYFTSNLEKFNKVFRRSLITQVIDDLDPAVLNSRMEVRMQVRYTPSLNVLNSTTINFPVAIADPDDVNLTIISTTFSFGGKTCSFKNELGSNKIQVVSVDGLLMEASIGSYNTSKGTLDIVGFSPTSIDGETIKITATPANQSTIRPLRNYILKYDEGHSFVKSTIDYQNTATSL